MASVTEKALGEKVLLALDPSEQLVKVVNDELIEILGPVQEDLTFDRELNIIMMCGLQGAGKTTTCGKLARLLQKQAGITPLLCAADLQRPAAIDQLHVLGDSLNVPVYSDREEQDPVKVCKAAVAKAKADGNKVLILDTAGRLAIDEALMQQLQTIDREVQPHHVFLVVDGMTGQDAVKSAGAFHEALELNGVVMTKLDGDARGGALLSVRKVTGVPVRFIGTGEHLEDFELFRPEGMASRILGMGDIVALAQQAQDLVSEEERLKLEAQLEKGQFTLDDFRSQQMMGNTDTSKQVKRMVGIIDSMTKEERRDPKVIDGSRKQRIAKGAGVQTKQINELLKQYNMMKPMLTSMAGKGGKGRMESMREMQAQLMNPGSMGPKTKKPTGKRLTPAQKKKAKREREKKMRERRRGKGGDA